MSIEPQADNIAAPARIVVHIDSFQASNISGWAFYENDPISLVTIELFVDNQPVAAIPCNLERLDVAAGGFPSAHVGFQAKLPARFFDSCFHEVELRGPARSELVGPEK